MNPNNIKKIKKMIRRNRLDEINEDIDDGIFTLDEYDEATNQINEENNIFFAKRLKEDHKIYCKKYLSDSKDFNAILQAELRYKRIGKEKFYLINAGTGYGKTYSIYENAKKAKTKFILVVPNVVVAKSMANEYEGSEGCSADNPLKQIVSEKPHVSSIFSTIDQINNVIGEQHKSLKEYVLIIDEAHTLYHSAIFRHKAVSGVEKAINENVFKNVIFMTATDMALTIRESDKDFQFIKLECHREITEQTFKLHRVEYHCNINQRFDAVVDYIDTLSKDGKVLVYNNRSKMQQKAMNEALGWSYVNADMKDSPTYLSIIEDGRIPEDIKVLVTTDIFTAGTNIYNEDFKHVVIIGERNPDTVKQFPARLRKVKEIHVHLVDTFETRGLEEDTYKFVLNKELKEQNLKLNKVGEKHISYHRGGLINGVFNEENKKITVNKFALSKKLLLNKTSYRSNLAFEYYLNEQDMTYSDINIVKIAPNENSNNASVVLKALRAEDKLDLEMAKDKFREIVVFDLDKIVLGEYNFNEFCKENEIEGNEKKALGIIASFYETGMFDTNKDFDLIFNMAVKKSYRDEIRTRVLVDKITMSGVVNDELIYLARNSQQGATVTENDYGHKKFYFGRFRTFARHLWEYEFSDGKLTFIKKKPTIKEEFDSLTLTKLELFYIGMIKVDKDEKKRMLENKIKIINRINEEKAKVKRVDFEY